jgi:CHAT domain-containing protein
MRPISPDGDEREFLGVEFAVGRWHLNQSMAGMAVAPQSLSIDKLIVIAPTYKGLKSLRSQEQEIETLKQINGYQRWPGQLSDLRRLFQEFPLGMIYFAGHGSVNSTRPEIWEYSIELEDGPLDVTTWRGMTNRQSNNHPLLFFNACEIGQTHRVANFIDGWAPAVLEAGASGYIGALWPVSDQGAAEFGINFYQELGQKLKLGPASVAETLQETRRKFLENGDPTFLSYVYFGDANLKLGPQPTKQ